MGAAQTPPPENKQVYPSAYIQEGMAFDEAIIKSDRTEPLYDTAHDSLATDSEHENIETHTDITDAKRAKEDEKDLVSETDLGASEPGVVSWGKHVW